MFSKTLDAKDVRCDVRFDGMTADWVVGDELRIGQVVINFLSNAVKFTSQGEVTVTFRQMLLREGTLDLMLRVHDTGIGWPAGCPTSSPGTIAARRPCWKRPSAAAK